MSLSYQTRPKTRNPVTITINGEEFACADWLPALELSHHAAALFSPGEISYRAPGQFFAAVMDEADFERFSKFISNPDNGVSPKLLTNIMLDLLEEYGLGPFPVRGTAEDDEDDGTASEPAPSLSGSTNGGGGATAS